MACGMYLPLDMVQAARKRARDAAAVAFACATFERAEAFAAALTLDLARCAALERETMVILADSRRLRRAAGRQAMV